MDGCGNYGIKLKSYYIWLYQKWFLVMISVRIFEILKHEVGTKRYIISNSTVNSYLLGVIKKYLWPEIIDVYRITVKSLCTINVHLKWKFLKHFKCPKMSSKQTVSLWNQWLSCPTHNPKIM